MFSGTLPWSGYVFNKVPNAIFTVFSIGRYADLALRVI